MVHCVSAHCKEKMSCLVAVFSHIVVIPYSESVIT